MPGVLSCETLTCSTAKRAFPVSCIPPLHTVEETWNMQHPKASEAFQSIMHSTMDWLGLMACRCVDTCWYLSTDARQVSPTRCADVRADLCVCVESVCY